jgi:hypothetical protein
MPCTDGKKRPILPGITPDDGFGERDHDLQGKEIEWVISIGEHEYSRQNEVHA